jgi:thioredoxin-dependent peroxiredoxin
VSVDAGQKAPGFDLPTDGGGRVRLEDFRGEPVVLYFYPKDDTSGCTKEAQGFAAAYPELRALGAEVIGVSKDGVASHDQFKAKYGLPFPLGSDEDGRRSRPTASGSRRACTGAATWASTARPS